MKYRLTKITRPSGFVFWELERKGWFWWSYVDSYIKEDTAWEALKRMERGLSEETREVLYETSKRKHTIRLH